MIRALVGLALVFAAVPSSAHEQALGHPEMKAMFVADQEARQGAITDWQAVEKADAVRRARTRELLDNGELTTAPDFYAAAFVFQHGGKPEDYLLAHVLAVRSLGLGMKEAEWIAAATLDRYLQSIDRPQIYGTQYSMRPGEKTSQAPIDRELVTDQLRSGAGVETLEKQREQLGKYDAAAKNRAAADKD